MSEWFWIILVALPIAGLVFIGLVSIQQRLGANGKRLNGSGSDIDPDDKPELVLGAVTAGLDTSSAMSEEKRRTLEHDLRAAGFYRTTALMEFTAIRTVLVLLPLFVGGILALLVDEEYMMACLGGAGMVAGLGYALPPLVLLYWGRLRRFQIEQGMPVGVDLLALALSGGQNLLSSLNRVSNELKLSYPILANEFQIVRRQADLRNLDHALNQMADRVNVDEVRNLTLILTQSQKLGTDIVTALHEFSNNFRVQVRQRAEARANKVSFWMLFPGIFCFWFPAAIMLVGPIYYQFRSESMQMGEIIEQSTQQVQQLNEPASPTPQPTPNQ